MKKEIDPDFYKDILEKNKWVKVILYGGVAVMGIWIMGKASRLLTDAIINFKNLNNAIKSGSYK